MDSARRSSYSSALARKRDWQLAWPIDNHDFRLLSNSSPEPPSRYAPPSYMAPVSRFEILVAWRTPLSSKVPRQITRSPSFTWLASMVLTTLLLCS
jgi:hypothetical protein